MSIRSFIAVPVPEHITDHLARLHESVPHAAGKIRWVKATAMHLTCIFLGDIEAGQVDPIAEALETVSRAVSPFVTNLDGVGAFPNFRRPRVVWVGFDQGEDEIKELKLRIDEALQPLGIEPERRAFHPHLTLGRVKSEGRRGLLEEAAAAWTLPFENWVSGEVVLFKSVLGRHGPTYTFLARLPLGGVGTGSVEV
jgi:2'-5' RNA ligase